MSRRPQVFCATWKVSAQEWHQVSQASYTKAAGNHKSKIEPTTKHSIQISKENEFRPQCPLWPIWLVSGTEKVIVAHRKFIELFSFSFVGRICRSRFRPNGKIAALWRYFRKFLKSVHMNIQIWTFHVFSGESFIPQLRNVVRIYTPKAVQAESRKAF